MTNDNNKILNNKNISQSVLPENQEPLDHGVLEGFQGSECEDTNNANTSSVVKYKRGHNPNSKKNLISLSDRTKEERIEIGRKGGLKSGEKRQERKTMRDTILEMLCETISDEMIEEYGLQKVLKGGGKSVQDAVIGATVLGAINGDVRCIQMLRDTIGEMPVAKTADVTEMLSVEDMQLIDDMKKSLIG